MTPLEMVPDVVLDDDHFLVFIHSAETGERVGAIMRHYKADGELCTANLFFDTPQARKHFAGKAAWIVKRWDPLTLEPSLVCHCGDHGFIRNGKWVKA